MSISQISGDQSQSATVRSRSPEPAESVATSAQQSSPPQTTKGVREPAAVVSDSLQLLNARPTTEGPSAPGGNPGPGELPIAIKMELDAANAQLHMAEHVSQMITSHSEVAVLAQAHQLPDATMPVSFDA